MKNSRQKKIIELITDNEIVTQEELAKRLVKEGFKVTQATVSRDIRTLKLYKRATADGRQCYAAPSEGSTGLDEKYLRVLKDGFISMDTAGNLLVVRTVSGMAMAVAAAIDALGYREIVGTIAGDDTIMTAVKTPEDAVSVMKKISVLITG